MIILEEPTVGLDPKQIVEIRTLIRRLAKNHTVILSSHILAEVREVCDYILIISGGKLVASDTPENLEKLPGEPDTVEIETEAPPAVVEETLKNVPGIERIIIKERKDGVTRAQAVSYTHLDVYKRQKGDRPLLHKFSDDFYQRGQTPFCANGGTFIQNT